MEEKQSVFSDLVQKKSVLLIVALILVSALGIWYVLWGRKIAAADYVTAKIERGNVINKVTATGTLQAVTTVQVGSQASGTISAIYVDFNSAVHKGQVIAKLDPASLQAQVQQAQASLDQSNAGYQVALANLSNANAQLVAARWNVLNQNAGVSSAVGNLNSLKAESDDALSLLKKQRSLFSQGVIAERDFEVAVTNYKSAFAKYEQALAEVNQAQVGERSAINSGIEQAQANVKQMQSQVQAAQAQIKQSRAALDLAQINLSHTVITSPVDGVVIARDVDVGQTVAASLSAPTLFSIANDLTQMQVLANVDEADIGSIEPADKVNFTVDAFPGETFSGTISQMRLNAQNVQNVVTYNVVINFDNPDQKLKPGMTANLTFIIAEKDDVLKIPNAAFRYVPQKDNRGTVSSNRNSVTVTNAAFGNENTNTENDNISPLTEPVLPGQTRVVWTLDENKNPRRHEIKIGINDGTATEMTTGDLQEGDAIIVSETTSATAGGTGTQSAPGFGGTGGGRPPGR